MSSDITSEIIDITPKMAEAMLCHNSNNRNVRNSVVERYARDMKEGNWKTTHQGIGFDTNGRLTDGQHRLMAVVRSGVTIKMMITRGLAPESFDVLDQGQRRNPGDILKAPPRIADVSNLAARLISGNRGNAPTDKLQKAHALLSHETEQLINGTSNAIFFSSAPMKLGAVVMMMAGEDRDYVRGLYAKLCRGDVDELPPVAQALIKMRLRSQIDAQDKLVVLAVSLMVFSKRNENMKTLRNVNPAGASEFVRNFITSRI